MTAVSKRPSSKAIACPSRMLALSLAHLPTDRIRRAELGRSWRSAGSREPAGIRHGTPAAGIAPLALFERRGNADTIASTCEHAARAGLFPGLGLAEARARFAQMDARPADPAADRRLVEALADWCDRYTPLVALDPPYGLILDISGCAHLFGGEKGLMDDLLSRLFHLGFAASAALAPTAGTAMACAATRNRLVLEPGEVLSAIEDLPVESLRLAPETSAALQRLGLKTLKALLALPRDSLARRFGRDLLVRLDEAAGTNRRPIEPRLPVPALVAERCFAEPIGRREDIERVLVFLANRLAGDLERRGKGGRACEVALFRADGQRERVRVRSVRPIRDPDHVRTLFADRMAGLGEDFDAGYGYDLVRLGVLTAETMEAVQTDLGEPERGETELPALLDRLMARLGEASVLMLETADSHWPERAQRLVKAEVGGPETRRQAVSTGAGQAMMQAAIPLRPSRLLERPEPIETTFALPDGPPLNFRWRRALHVVRRYEGPERIAPEWWRDAQGRARDYYRVEDENGRRYWLFREGTSEPGRPGWYIHGLFA